jgi:hypothetical protein
MMYNYSVYELNTGRFTGFGSNPNQELVEAGEGQGLVEGHYNPETQMVVGGVVVDIPETAIEQEELSRAWGELKYKRNRLLQNSDWSQVPDAPVDAAAWALYRQRLRDLPDNTTDPHNTVWPEHPQSNT